jgi:uncharacterized membrane protein YgdD (TMEM256/DUF423 family)
LFRVSDFELRVFNMTRLAAALCFLGVALGAFGAHAFRSRLEGYGLVDVWNKAVLYHLIHGAVLLFLSLMVNSNRIAWWLLFAGVLIFSGSLYAMGLTNARWLGAITPIGGLCLLLGWVWFVFAPPRL